MRTGSLIGLFLLVTVALQAQLNRGGVPWSFSLDAGKPLQPDLILSPPDLPAIEEEDLLNPVPYRFAINLSIDIGISRQLAAGSDPASGIRHPASGTWTTLPSGDRIWQVTVKAPGAKAITLYFDRFTIPAGGKLFVYNEDKSSLLGAFTELNNSASKLFSTALIPGDQVTVEYNQPVTMNTLPDIHISELAYAYRGVPEITDQTGFGSSGPCEVNVACQEGDAWQEQQQGVARVGVKKFGATYWCSGSLVNNVRNDYTPYFLTADHCAKGATPQDIGQWIFYFNYSSPTCDDPPAEPASRSLTGAVEKAAAGDVNISGSDFFLVLLNQQVPDTFGVWFNGWNREDLPSPDGVGIHHPMGDIKKISTYTSPLNSTNWNGHPEQTHWQVVWSGTPNGHGVTEGGSSGSPIFDDQGRIIGTLTGGNALCDSAFLNQPDYYGKFSYSWDMNGPDSTKRLDYWLDPDNTGVMMLNGIPLVVPEPQPSSPSMTIYPNPASGTVQLKSSLFQNSTGIKVVLVDSWGRKAGSFVGTGSQNGEVSLDISRLPNGFYLARVLSETVSVTGRIVKL